MFRRALVGFLRASDIGKEKFRLLAPVLLVLSLLLEAAPVFPGRGLLLGLLSLAISAFYMAEDLGKALRSPLTTIASIIVGPEFPFKNLTEP